MNHIIEVKNLQKKFGDNEVLRDINAHVDEKEVVCVIGPSGSGKSTLLRCMNLLEDITSGDIIVDGQSLTAKNLKVDNIRSEIGMVFQQFNLFPHKTVMENIILAPMKIRKLTKSQAVERGRQLLKKWGCLTKKMRSQRSWVGNSSVLLLRELSRWNQKLCCSMSQPQLLILNSWAMCSK